MAWLQVKNKAESTLNGAINDVVTSMVVTSATPFPTTTPFRLTLEDEIVEVTAIASTTFTITRGVESTTGAAHADGTPVYLNILASIIQEIQAAIFGQTKVKAETRDLEAESGNVAYTGYGFTPKGLIIFAVHSSGAYGSVGGSNPALGSICGRMATDFKFTTNIIYIYGGTGKVQEAIVASYDADGFTLTWTKTGLPTGTISLNVFAFK